jgi:hypothetical protein
MSKQITMVFWRDEYTYPGCLEYSWVPEGLRHNIQLPEGIQEGKSTDSISDDLNPSHVQVYVASNGSGASIEMWQFPSGPPGASPVAAALVEMFERRNLVVGTVFYEDGTTASAWAKLDPYGRKCPQEQST